MEQKPKTIKSKSLSIKSAPNTANFNLVIDDVNYGMFKKHNVVKTNTLDSTVRLSLSFLTKVTHITLRIMKDEQITVKWNRLRGRFEIEDNTEIITSQKTQLTPFSKVFYPLITSVILVCLLVLLIIFLSL